ncbi:MAG: DUF1573 domain-containing protein [Bacteroidales bacterium]|nr:DUF1573 domain-containing protein [Bacteroidales bacterium]
MIKIFFLVSFTFFFSFQSISQVRTPILSFEKTVHDFGTIKEADGNVQYTFKFTNTGATPLIVTNVEASCGCTTPEWTKTPILPGKTGYVNTEFNPANYQKFDKSIIVYSNGNPASVTLRVVGEVVPKEKLMADIFAYAYGNARVKGKNIAFASLSNKEKDVIFEFYNHSNAEINLSFLDLPSFVSVDNKSIKIAAEQIATVRFTANPNKTSKGFHKELINIQVDGKTYENALKIIASVK